MSDDQNSRAYEDAIATIRNAGLPHPNGYILESFLDESINPNLAAAYFLNAIKHNSIITFLSGWKSVIHAFMCDTIIIKPPTHVTRIVTQENRQRCCITGFSGSFWDPLLVVPIIPPTVPTTPSGETLRAHGDMLDAFLSPEVANQLFSARSDVPESYWLLRKSSFAALKQGYFKLSFGSNPTRYEVDRNLAGGPVHPPVVDEVEDFRRGKFSSSHTPDKTALEIISRFAGPIRWSCISQQIASRKQRQKLRSLIEILSTPFCALSSLSGAVMRAMWVSLVPAFVRARAYRSLIPLGRRMYGFSDSFNVQRLPFGLYLKVVSASSRRESLVNEHGSLQLVRKHTRLPVPTPFDFVEDEGDDKIYLLTTRMKGHKVGLCLDAMTDEDAAALVYNLGEHWKALRNIPRPGGHKNAISNAVDGPVFDHRINAALDQDEKEGPEDTVGPFATEADLNSMLRCGAIPDVMHDSGHDIVFTHGDINMRNILVDENGKLTGVVDWENAGWLPDYWDYTKAYFVTKRNERWLAMVDEVFGRFGDFKRELQVERELWKFCF